MSPLPIPYVFPPGTLPEPPWVPTPVVPAYVQPYYIREAQNWAVEQERMRHAEALYSVGEWTIFVLMWHIEDFQRGLIDRCHKCFVAFGKVADAYGQSSQNKCTDCYGTTFESGFKAIIVRPAIFADTDESERFDKRGVVHDDSVDMESTPDFRVRTGDYAFRIDGTRWQLKVPQRVTVRTGFRFPGQHLSAIGYNHAQANLEDPTAVAYIIPPEEIVISGILRKASHWPIDFSADEVIRGPLIPDDVIGGEPQ